MTNDEEWALTQITIAAPVGKERLAPLVRWLETDGARAAYRAGADRASAAREAGKSDEDALKLGRKEIRRALRTDDELCRLERTLDDRALDAALIAAERSIVRQSFADQIAVTLQAEDRNRQTMIGAGCNADSSLCFLDLLLETMLTRNLDEEFRAEGRTLIAALRAWLARAPNAWRPRAAPPPIGTLLWDWYTSQRSPMTDEEQASLRKHQAEDRRQIDEDEELVEECKRQLAPRRGRPPADPGDEDIHTQLVQLGASAEEARRAIGCTPEAARSRRRRRSPGGGRKG